MKSFIYIFIIFFLNLCLAKNDIEDQIHTNRKQLDKVKQEMEVLRKNIARADIKASSTLEQIKILDREISLINKSKRLLGKETNLLSKRIRLTRDQLDVSRRKLHSLKDRYQNRVVQLYKYGKIQNIEILLNSNSINQALVRYKYLKFFNDQEKNIIRKINSRVKNIQELEQNLSHDYQRQRQSLKNTEKRASQYLARKDEKRILVRRLKWNSQNLSKKLNMVEEEYQKLYQLIVTLERQRQLRTQSGEQKQNYSLNLRDFKKSKGKLPWPVKGSVIHKYGKQYDAKLKTTINNTGVDIKATNGTEVKAVFIGLVSMITYLSGYGNTVILDHGEGYYTVYSHLDEFFVKPDQLVDIGNVIGLVGDSGSLEGSKLHFAIFANQKTENPHRWLR